MPGLATQSTPRRPSPDPSVVTAGGDVPNGPAEESLIGPAEEARYGSSQDTHEDVCEIQIIPTSLVEGLERLRNVDPSVFPATHEVLRNYRLPMTLCMADMNIYPIGMMDNDVFRGRQGNDVDVVVKQRRIAREQLPQDHDRRQAVICRMAAIMNGLQHVNILPLLGVTIVPDAPCLEALSVVSPFMQMGTLSEYIKRCQLSFSRRFELLRDVAEGLAYLHDRGIMHRNIQGNNILVSDDGHACIGGFGSAVIDGSDNVYLAGSLTCRWRAPEIIPDEAAFTPASDVFAFGFLLYEVLIKELHMNPSSKATAMIFQGRRPLRRPTDAPLPDHIWRLMEECWSLRPSDRPCASCVLSRLSTILASSYSTLDTRTNM